MSDINKIRKGIDTYFKLKFFIYYIAFSAIITFILGMINVSFALLIVGVFYMILLNNYKEEFINGEIKEK